MRLVWGLRVGTDDGGHRVHIPTSQARRSAPAAGDAARRSHVPGRITGTNCNAFQGTLFFRREQVITQYVRSHFQNFLRLWNWFLLFRNTLFALQTQVNLLFERHFFLILMFFKIKQESKSLLFYY